MPRRRNPIYLAQSSASRAALIVRTPQRSNIAPCICTPKAPALRSMALSRGRRAGARVHFRRVPPAVCPGQVTLHCAGKILTLDISPRSAPRKRGIRPVYVGIVRVNGRRAFRPDLPLREPSSLLRRSPLVARPVREREREGSLVGYVASLAEFKYTPVNHRV